MIRETAPQRPNQPSSYRFRPLVPADLVMIEAWLRTPEVMRWWGDPGEQHALISADMQDPAMRQWIVETQGRPFAYVQAYAPASWPQPHLADLPAGSQAIDTFIGEPDMLGQGHGSGFLRAFAEMLISEGASLLVIDPDADNHRARSAYMRAGFVGGNVVETGDGPAILMFFG
ncbi:MAG: GNAT family N-acetyltransferase [Alphaproteobacteria bacterium]